MRTIRAVQRPARRTLALVLLVVALCAWIPRSVGGLRHPRARDSSAGWFSVDPDGLYHARRVERVFREGLPVAGTDPYLDFPSGAAIPWPPYYDLSLWALLAPFAPRDAEARHAFVERWVSTLPAAWSVLTALLACAAGWMLAGPTAALWAGVYGTLGWGALNYGRVGTGDHHAWVTLLHVLLLLLLTRALARDVLASPRRAAAYGAGCGVVIGLLLGSWVAALLHVVYVQAALGWLLVRRGREQLPGAAALGLALHLAALAALTPAVLASPWKQELPWMVVNLSWFHLAYLALSALVFLPPALLERSRLATGTRAARLYPLAVAGALALGGLLLWATGAAPARGIAEGFAWVARADAFMDAVLESLPLLGARAGGGGELFLALGFGVLLLPLAWALAARDAFWRHDLRLLPWVVSVPPLLVQALQQRRFSEALAAPMAVVLGYAAARLLARLRPVLALSAALLAALLLQAPALLRASKDFSSANTFNIGTPLDHILGERALAEWIRLRTQPPQEAGAGWSVLAHWDRGHLLEWAADRPTVATNFGSYIGLQSYADPARFFLETDPERARALLERRRVRYVFVPASLPSNVPSMLRIAPPPEPQSILAQGPGGGRQAGPRWPLTMAARLLYAHGPRAGGQPPPAAPAPDSLRLVHISPYRNAGFQDPSTGGPAPAGFLWERVQGAVLEAHGAPGEKLEVRMRLGFRPETGELTFETSAAAGTDGVARVRIPYPTDGPFGDGRALEARWSLGSRSGVLEIAEQAVQHGAIVRLQ